MMSAWGPNGDVVYMDSIPTHLIYDDEQQTAGISPVPPAVRGVEPGSPPTLIHDGPSQTETRGVSKSASPTFSGGKP